MSQDGAARVPPWNMPSTRRGPRRRFLSAALGLAAIACLGAGGDAIVDHTPSMSGCWRGCWVSHCSGHKGKLRATICRCDATHYRAEFSGTFFKILPFKYSVVLTGIPEGDRMRVVGTSNLGKLGGGTYHYTGYVTACEFHLNYCTKKDRGKFEMRRE